MTAIAIAAPIRPSARSGNDVTAARWAGHLIALGHTVEVVAVDEFDRSWPGSVLDDADVLLAMHARRSSIVATSWAERHPDRPLIVALTGTDLYLDLPTSDVAMAAVEAANRLIVLQPAAVDRLGVVNASFAEKAAVVHQSVDPATLPARRPAEDEFRVVVLAHLREVKDPLLAARAVRHLSPQSSVRVHHAGRAMDDAWAAAATTEERENPRYRWYGELVGPAAMELLATAHLLACTSIEEGGANVVTEAIALGVPVVGTRMDGNTGLLGADHPGLVPVGDDRALARLLARVESDPGIGVELQRRTDALRSVTDPAAERLALANLLDSVQATGPA